MSTVQPGALFSEVMTPPEPMRADARGNRAKILEVAERVFGEGGSAASTEEIARLAGVGIATVFRHFPTKRDLLTAVLARHFDLLREQAQELAEAADPGEAFFGFFAKLVADAPGKLAIAEAFEGAGGTATPQSVHDLREAVGVLLRRAQDAGVVRADAGLDEVYALLTSASRTAAAGRLDEPVRGRVLAIIFDGLAPAHEVQSRA